MMAENTDSLVTFKILAPLRFLSILFMVLYKSGNEEEFLMS